MCIRDSCGAWPERPLHRGFGADVDAAAEVSDADVRELLERYVTAALAPLKAAGGVRDGDVAAAAALPGVEWNAHYQLLGGRVYVVGGEPPPVNHHHRKRLRGVRMILSALLAEYAAAGATPPDVEFVINFSDAPKVCLLYTSPSPRDRTRSRMPSSA